jgi:hypothetical protein
VSQNPNVSILKPKKKLELNPFQIANAKVAAFIAKGNFKTRTVKGKKYYCFFNKCGEIVLSPIRANLPNAKIKKRFEDGLFWTLIADIARGNSKVSLLADLDSLLVHEERLDFTNVIHHFSAIDSSLKTEILNGEQGREVRLDAVIGIINIILKVQDAGLEHKISELLNLAKIKFRRELSGNQITGDETVYVLGQPIEIGYFTKLTKIVKRLKAINAFSPEEAIEINVLLGELGTNASDLRDYLKADLKKHDSAKAIRNTIFKHFNGKKVFLNPALI